MVELDLSIVVAMTDRVCFSAHMHLARLGKAACSTGTVAVRLVGNGKSDCQEEGFQKHEHR
jgi:hypothetical protein